MADFFNHEALREFILAQMRQRNLSQHEFARKIGVSQPTIQRAINFGETPPMPSLEFLIKLSRGTSTDLSTLIALLVPGSGTLDGRVTILLAQIARLPERQREAAEIMLRGLLLEAGQEK